LIRSGKILIVAMVVGGLVTASVFTFGAAIPLVGSLTVASSTASAAGAFALLGAATGLALSSVLTIGLAKLVNMHTVTEKNAEDIMGFLVLSIGGSAVITGLFAASGAGMGLKGIVAAKAGLSTLGTVALLGGGAAIAKTIIES
jgi:hypothetical protein